MPHQSILARLQSFRENSTKTKKTYTARLPRQGIFASLPAKSSVKIKEKKEKNADNKDNAAKYGKEKKTFNALSRQGLPAKFL